MRRSGTRHRPGECSTVRATSGHGRRIDRDTKLVVSWLVSQGRDATAASQFMTALELRLTHRVHLTTDGHGAAV